MSDVERMRSLVSRLIEAAESRKDAEEAAAEAYAAATGSARTRHEEDLQAAHARRDAESRAETLDHRETANRIRQESRTAFERTQARYHSARDGIEEKAETNLAEARKQWDEAVWVSDTVFEAKEPEPAQKHEQTLRGIEGRREELDALEERSRQLVRKYRQSKVLERLDAARGRDDARAKVAGDRLDEETATARRELARLERLHVARLFRGYIMPLDVVIVLGAASAGVLWWRQWTIDGPAIGGLAGAVVLVAAIVAACYALARRATMRTMLAIDAAVARARAACDDAAVQSAAQRDAESRAMRDKHDREITQARARFEPIIAQIEERRTHHRSRLEEKYPPRLEEIRARGEEDLADEAVRHEREVAAIAERHAAAVRDIEAALGAALEKAERERDAQAGALTERWEQDMTALVAEFRSLEAAARAQCPDWTDDSWRSWNPPTTFPPAVRVGALEVDRASVRGGVPEDAALAVDLPGVLDVPLTLDLDAIASLVLRHQGEGSAAAVDSMQATMLRLLTALPPGKVRFTIVDPVGLGRSFAGFMHLADHDEAFITSRIWTEPRHIEQRLADLTDHMENVIQKYLRNEFRTISSYNERAGEIAEPYRFLVVANFPANFSDQAAQRLLSIAESGPRCGVFVIVGVDDRQPMPRGFDLADLERHALTLVERDGRFAFTDETLAQWPLELESPPDDAFVTRILNAVGTAAQDATRVEVPFATVSPDNGAMWSRRCDTELTVPLGRCGATKLQELAIGRGTSQHVLIAGKTGSGKSTLLHVIATNLAMWYSPDEVQIYLVDFKKGVEFKTYATHRMPHARAVAIESDREFGLSVLERIDADMRERGDRFRDLGVQDLAGYRRLPDQPPLPRLLLVVDEFQELFVEDDRVGQESALLLDRIIRQGRAFGIHALLGSQTLGGAYTLARSTIGQMQVRIALQCSEADSYMILSEDNSAARLLSRPGEAIYNDAGGAIEGNSPFQIVWLPDSERDGALARVRERAERELPRREPMVVFEGNVPARIDQNTLLTRSLDGTAPKVDGRIHPASAWLGDAIAIKDPTAARFRRQSGRNLLIVGQRDESALAMMMISLLSLAAQHAPADGVRFVVLDGTPADAPGAGMLAGLAERLPHATQVVEWRGVEGAMAELAAELEARQDHDAPERPPVYVLVHGLQRYRMLRTSDDFGFSMGEEQPASPDRQFADLLREGPPLGMHVLTWSDTAANLARTIDRQGMREFEMRVLFQMSGADSTNLVDTPAATNLGLHRALFHDEETGVLEKFRPYALPETPWIDAVIRTMGGDGAART